jgi:hypothetical protein
MSDDLNKLILFWHEQGLPLAPPETPESVRRAFCQINARCSEDVIELYCATGGMSEDMDSNMFSLWPLGKIVDSNVDRHSRDVAFGDYCIYCWDYSFRFETAQRSTVFGGPDYRMIADSVEGFLHLLLTDANQLTY